MIKQSREDRLGVFRGQLNRDLVSRSLINQQDELLSPKIKQVAHNNIIEVTGKLSTVLRSVRHTTKLAALRTSFDHVSNKLCSTIRNTEARQESFHVLRA